jgi:hypothetical protein
MILQRFLFLVYDTFIFIFIISYIEIYVLNLANKVIILLKKQKTLEYY